MERVKLWPTSTILSARRNRTSQVFPAHFDGVDAHIVQSVHFRRVFPSMPSLEWRQERCSPCSARRTCSMVPVPQPMSKTDSPGSIPARSMNSSGVGVFGVFVVAGQSALFQPLGASVGLGRVCDELHSFSKSSIRGPFSPWVLFSYMITRRAGFVAPVSGCFPFVIAFILPVVCVVQLKSLCGIFNSRLVLRRSAARTKGKNPMQPREELTQLIGAALDAAIASENFRWKKPPKSRSSDPEMRAMATGHGTAAMRCAKEAKRNPREIAQDIVDALP